MVEQMAEDVALPQKGRRERGRMAHPIHSLQDLHGTLGQGSILQQYRKPSCEAWAPVKQCQGEQDLAQGI